MKSEWCCTYSIRRKQSAGVATCRRQCYGGGYASTSISVQKNFHSCWHDWVRENETLSVRLRQPELWVKGRPLSRHLNGEKDCSVVSYGSRSVRIRSRRVASRLKNTNPNSGVFSARHPSLISRSIVAVITLRRSMQGSRRWHSTICHCKSKRTTYRGVLVLA